jgi:hypothetical protein
MSVPCFKCCDEGGDGLRLSPMKISVSWNDYREAVFSLPELSPSNIFCVPSSSTEALT